MRMRFTYGQEIYYSEYDGARQAKAGGLCDAFKAFAATDFTDFNNLALCRCWCFFRWGGIFTVIEGILSASLHAASAAIAWSLPPFPRHGNAYDIDMHDFFSILLRIEAEWYNFELAEIDVGLR